MNRTNYDKSKNMLEDAIVHFLTVSEFQIVGELCECSLKCDEIFYNSNNVIIQNHRLPAS